MCLDFPQSEQFSLPRKMGIIVVGESLWPMDALPLVGVASIVQLKDI